MNLRQFMKKAKEIEGWGVDDSGRIRVLGDKVYGCPIHAVFDREEGQPDGTYRCLSTKARALRLRNKTVDRIIAAADNILRMSHEAYSLRKEMETWIKPAGDNHGS